MTEDFFADTYALIEMSGQNPRYAKYRDTSLHTTQWNLAELYYHFLNEYGGNTADEYFEAYADLVIEITPSSIKDAMRLKSLHKKEHLSYVDCIGYSLAKEFGIRFLTGDQKFKNKENVEFVK
jgi:predicted nucleic acid-binding protein